MEITGSDLLGFIFAGLFNEAAIPSLPLFIEQFSTGNTQLIDSTVTPQFAGLLAGNPLVSSEGVNNSVSCVDEQRLLNSRDRAAVRNPGIYDTVSVFNKAIVGSYCDRWQVPSAPASFNRPVRSNIPTLLVAGSFDPITLPKQTRNVGQYLPRSVYVEILNSGHVPLFSSACAQSVLADFLLSPLNRPNTSCTQASQVKFLEKLEQN